MKLQPGACQAGAPLHAHELHAPHMTQVEHLPPAEYAGTAGAWAAKGAGKHGWGLRTHGLQRREGAHVHTARQGSGSSCQLRDKLHLNVNNSPLNACNMCACCAILCPTAIRPRAADAGANNRCAAG